MTASRRDRGDWTRSISTALVALSLIGSAAVFADDAPASKLAAEPAKVAAKAEKKTAGRLAKTGADAAKNDPSAIEAEKVRKALAGFREIKAALDAEDAPSPKASMSSALAARPKKVVVPPTLTSYGLDAMLDATITGSHTPVAVQTTDEEFVRRVYLDVTGKLPTIPEMRAFVTSHEKSKRAKLIDHLLKTDAYAANWARYWRDVFSFRAPNEALQQLNYPAFEAWLAGEFKQNRPWDEIVTKIVTAEGPNTENGATNFGIAQMGQAVELAGEVSRVFMGVQIQCAQCHDHPSDIWKREQFHEFASFFAGVRAANVGKGAMPRVFGLIAQKGSPRYAMPDLKDPAKSIPVNPKFFLSDASVKPIPGLTSDQRRALAASYVTGQDNPWFAKAFVNRVWGALMGDGFSNPIDDLGPTKDAKTPEILEKLASQWQQGGYDVEWLFRTILNAKAYQRESRSTESASGRTPFAANCPSRLRSDQIFDALAHALDFPAEQFGRGRRPNPAQRDAAAKQLTKLPQGVQLTVVAAAQRNNAPRVRFGRTFGVDPSTPNDDVVGTIPQALYLMNDKVVNNGIKAAKTAVLGELLQSTPDNRAVLDVLYLRVLARRPNLKEVHVCGRHIETVGNRAEAFEDIFWSLINSTEFISRR